MSSNRRHTEQVGSRRQSTACRLTHLGGTPGRHPHPGHGRASSCAATLSRGPGSAVTYSSASTAGQLLHASQIGKHQEHRRTIHHPTAATGADLAKNGEPVALRAALWNVWLPAPGATGNVSLIQEVICACSPAQRISM